MLHNLISNVDCACEYNIICVALTCSFVLIAKHGQFLPLLNIVTDFVLGTEPMNLTKINIKHFNIILKYISTYTGYNVNRSIIIHILINSRGGQTVDRDRLVDLRQFLIRSLLEFINLCYTFVI